MNPQRSGQILDTLLEAAADLFAVVQQEPGCNLTQARDRTGLARRAFAAVLDVLVDAGRVLCIGIGREKVLFATRPGLNECMKQIRALWNPQVRQLHGFLSTRDVWTHQGVIEYASDAWNWSMETTRWRLRVLEESELVQAFMDMRDQRRVLYRCLPAHPLMQEILEPAP